MKKKEDLPLGATWSEHLEWCEMEMAASRGAGQAAERRLAHLYAEAARCREEIIRQEGGELTSEQS